MKKYMKKIKDYRELVENRYVKDTAVEDTIKKCETVIGQVNEEIFGEGKLSSFEFLYGQSKFIQKRWWVLQGAVLFLIWILLSDFESRENVLRMLPSMATIFAVLIIPEMWKNRRFSTVEIEKTTFYSLRQIMAARMLLFGIVDVAMMTIFLGIVSNTIQIEVYKIIIDFLIPFNVSCCICFRLLYSKRHDHDMEYVAFFLNLICTVAWSAIAGTDFIYRQMAMPLWIGILALSLGYLIYCVQKLQRHYELIVEEQENGITI